MSQTNDSSDRKPARRHPHVVNLDEVPAQERMVGTKMGARFIPVAAAAGARHLGCTVYEVPPGRVAMPRHFHCGNEEALFVLSGTDALRLGDATIPLRPGDWVTFPCGPQHPHQVANDGAEPLRYLGLSTKNNVDVIGYPDSRKVMAAAIPPGSDWFGTPWVRKLFPDEAAVDYMFREETE